MKALVHCLPPLYAALLLFCATPPGAAQKRRAPIEVLEEAAYAPRTLSHALLKL